MSDHIGRSWSGTFLEDGCPCPKEACGLVDRSKAAPECLQHPVARYKTIRQGHRAEECPDARATGAVAAVVAPEPLLLRILRPLRRSPARTRRRVLEMRAETREEHEWYTRGGR